MASKLLELASNSCSFSAGLIHHNIHRINDRQSKQELLSLLLADYLVLHFPPSLSRNLDPRIVVSSNLDSTSSIYLSQRSFH